MKFSGKITFICLVFFLALPAAAKGQSTQQAASPPPFEYPPCDPPVGDIVFGSEGSELVSTRITVLFDQDQSREKNAPDRNASREASNAYWTKVSGEDRDRQSEVMGYLRKGQINSADDLYHVAMIFQHGDCPDHFKLANTLAEKAMGKGSDKAKWLYAATLDRHLMSQGKPQKFGTQFVLVKTTGMWVLYQIEPGTTDEDRERYNVPPLAIQKQKLERMNQPKEDSSKTR